MRAPEKGDSGALLTHGTLSHERSELAADVGHEKLTSSQAGVFTGKAKAHDTWLKSTPKTLAVMAWLASLGE